MKEAESMKSHSGGVGSRMEQNKEGKIKLLLLSLALLIIYIYIYICIVKNKRLLNACMTKNGMCVFAESKL